MHALLAPAGLGAVQSADSCLQAADLITEYVLHLHGCISDLINGRCIQLMSWIDGRAGIT